MSSLARAFSSPAAALSASQQLSQRLRRYATSTPSTSAASASFARGGTMARFVPSDEGRAAWAARRAHRERRRRARARPRNSDALERLGRHHAERRHRRGGDGEIEAAAVLALVGWGQVDDDAVLRELDAHLGERALHANAALADRGLCEPDELERWDAPQGLHLDADA